MKIITLLAGGALLLAADMAAAQPNPSAHEQHQVSGKHQSATTDHRCCCDEQMKQMMSMMHGMMQMHQQMHQGMKMPMQSPAPNENPPRPGQQKN